MGRKPKVPCRYFNCPELLDHPGYCDKHKAMMGYVSDEYHHLYNNDRWRNYSKNYLKKHPLCVQCKREGKIVPSGVTDHILQHRGDPVSFWDPKNHQALCVPCHSEKTARETGIVRENNEDKESSKSG
jgi:5-methylcytosine-specific restriction enzyme A